MKIEIEVPDCEVYIDNTPKIIRTTRTTISRDAITISLEEGYSFDTDYIIKDVQT